MLLAPAFLVLTFATTASAADITAEEAMAELQFVVEHVAAVEAAKEEGAVEGVEGPTSAVVEMASICYIVLPDGKIQLEHCVPVREEEVKVSPATARDLQSALALAPEPYRLLDPAGVLPCALARTAQATDTGFQVIVLNN